MFNFFKKAETFDPLERGSKAVSYAAKLAQTVPFRYLLASSSDGNLSFAEYSGVFVEHDKVHILKEEERAQVADFLMSLRNKDNKNA